ncbi:LPS biosynthesis protein RfbU [Flavobacterium noncentrifugens]|uniref:Glycosyl transferases group 1 n=1 Tax=Flavobacterium noncentrifugens TaxID=1128970 RepID=A0A1G8V8W4_9FLAO|nr:glycosyltransferase family 4 protein [Flavobacterium noncentrifugens]GEP50395.1 LPS biosynthesis protein RfbU [Flavobacterium noncentrifugens]SDJ62532.1 Glycosyl transferases group 1 [Flavobacterium noncentrifugens]
MAVIYFRSLVYRFATKISKKFDSVAYKGLKKYDLIIYDDLFPHPSSGFRLAEFTALLQHFKNSKIIGSAKSYAWVKTPAADHEKHVADFTENYPSLKKKIRIQKRFFNVNTKVFYCIFLNNIFDNLKWIENYQIPFIFTLYPGGGFEIEGTQSDSKLKKVLASPMFRKVIVTQKLTLDYLLDNGFCKPEQAEYIFGGVVPQSALENVFRKKQYLKDKQTLDLCFCAAKYMPKGLDKGYDVFIEAAVKLTATFDFIRFHVIGGFDANDIDVSAIADKIHFYGYQKFDGLQEIYNNMDVIVSPNRPFLLGKGAFDGFPLGTVVEAVFNGVVAVISDKLFQNTVFNDGTELVIVESNSDSIVSAIKAFIENPEKLHQMANAGKNKFLNVYSDLTQLPPRQAILQYEIDKR